MNLVDWLTHYSDRFNVPSQISHAIAAAASGYNPMLVTALPDNVWLAQNTNRPYRRLTEAEARSFTPPADFGTIDLDELTNEWVGQRCAWGPMQMWGSCLRLSGYKGEFAQHCCDPELASKWACRHLSFLRDRYGDRHGWAGVVAAYGSGRPRKDEDGAYINQAFVDAVSRAGASRFF